MANYYGKARTNTFKVKDLNAFEIAAEKYGEIVPTKCGVYMLAHDEGGEFQYYEEDQEEYSSLGEIIAGHLQEGEVAIIIGIGSEKHRYLDGWAKAYHSSGETVSITLQDIYRDAAEAFPGSSITSASN